MLHAKYICFLTQQYVKKKKNSVSSSKGAEELVCSEDYGVFILSCIVTLVSQSSNAHSHFTYTVGWGVIVSYIDYKVNL